MERHFSGQVLLQASLRFAIRPDTHLAAWSAAFWEKWRSKPDLFAFRPAGPCTISGSRQPVCRPPQSGQRSLATPGNPTLRQVWSYLTPSSSPPTCSMAPAIPLFNTHYPELGTEPGTLRFSVWRFPSCFDFLLCGGWVRPVGSIGGSRGRKVGERKDRKDTGMRRRRIRMTWYQALQLEET